jgi:hypothetical protein
VVLTKLAIALSILSAIAGCARAADYQWTKLTASAAFDASYNFPVHVAGDGRFVALHPDGAYVSSDGAVWRRGALDSAGLNSAYLAYVAHEGAAYALGTMTGNYLGFTIDPVIRRTADYENWSVVGRSDSLPSVVFYAAASFDGFLWIIGGYDGAAEVDDVWRSRDGVRWERIADAAGFGARMGARAVVFGDRLYLIGGGELDGALRNDVWSTSDGRNWRQETAQIAQESPVGYAPIVFDGKLWLVGANRSGVFSSEMLVWDDGREFRAERAPWSPRGGVAVWTDGDRLYMTGGKYSTGEGANIRFAYSNDVWVMRRQPPEKEKAQ